MFFDDEDRDAADASAQIPYDATVDQSVSDACEGQVPADEAMAPNPDHDADTHDESRGHHWIFKRHSPQWHRQWESGWGVAYLIFVMLLDLFLAVFGFWFFVSSIKQDMGYIEPMWLLWPIKILELVVVVQYFASIIGILVFLVVRTARSKRLLKRTLWLWTLAVVVLCVIAMVVSYYVNPKNDVDFLLIALFSLMVPLSDFNGKYGHQPINDVILKK
ncbi:hypothetical protein [Bifidobacterium sp. ESL0704]|uniref:hypothetical protein n=1 Tax=Bifidobacterium sp. ESL0704 TaxID=2983219 RepID=UPI0023F8A048|nr:hypothetical protein [Bifidobacterium sp. ESL0704]WEV52140.1 hypothetical protein OZX64_04260 [Bifidobacterium sp. ESL0704]